MAVRSTAVIAHYYKCRESVPVHIALANLGGVLVNSVRVHLESFAKTCWSNGREATYRELTVGLSNHQ